MSSYIPEICNDCGFCVPTANSQVYVCKHDYSDGLTIVPNETRTDCPLHDDILDSRRFIVPYRGETFYVVVVLKDDVPYELFAEHPTNSDPSLYYMMSSIDTITRLATMCLKKHTLQKVINQMARSSRTKNDFPGIISRVLTEWIPKTI